MWNGFYDLSSIKDEKTLKNLFKDALELSTDCHVDEMVGWQRKRTDIDPNDYINDILKLNDYNVVINRKAYYINHHKDGEVGSSSSYNKYIFIYLSLENLDKIVVKYNLQPKFL